MAGKKIDWFTNARFGMFIHWGLYSILERGKWDGEPFQMVGVLASKGKNLYYHIQRWPGREVYLSGVKNTVKSATLMSGNKKLSTEKLRDGRILITGLPKKPPEKFGTVIKPHFASTPKSAKRKPLGDI